MILITIFLSFAVIANMALGTIVFQTNRKRRVNQTYLVAATFMLLWLLANLLVLHSKTPEQAIVAINVASALSACIPSSFQLLRLAIKYPTDSWQSLLRRCTVQIVLNITVVTLCFLPSFTKSVTLYPGTDTSIGLAQPDYGILFVLFSLYMLGSIVALGYNLFRDRKLLQGAQRLELEFLVFACWAGMIVGVLIGTVSTLITKSSSAVPIANSASVFTVSLIVAYGITVHRILTVSALLRRATAHAFLSACLSIIYYITWYVTIRLCEVAEVNPLLPSHLFPALAIMFSMLPARQRLQSATDRLFSSSYTFDPQTTVKKASNIFQSVKTIDSLQIHYSELLLNVFDAGRVVILAPRNRDSEEFIQLFPPIKGREGISYTKGCDLVRMLAQTKEPICADSLARIRETPAIRNVAHCLGKDRMSIAAGFFSESKLKGIVLVGDRRKNRIYDRIEQDTLQILCNQFAVALENAQMYTEMQDSKIRNEIMLDQLVSGVILANTERRITLFNHEAQRITGIYADEAMGKDIDVLPKPIALSLDDALKRKKGKRNIDAGLFEQDEANKSLNIRMGTTFLLGHDQNPMGALLVCTDMTELKSLEEQVRRSDQLSSVGTLAAGMAHEIKNPLVTIKTFTQLLPERYADEDFRNDFSSLVAHEVSRIDGIVNELLSFSKPTKPHLVPMHLHDTIEQMLKLTHEQMLQKNISIKNKCNAATDTIQGDAKLLSQALINLTLNAIEAIGTDGAITVGTSNCKYRFADGEEPARAITKKSICIQISDTGQGIAQENLKKIFDPFFTSKSKGTGMGLSVAHGIINEHHGVVEVESETGKGTTFYIYMPLLEGVTTA